MPDEGAPHDATWMSLQVDPEMWGEELAAGARSSLSLTAAEMARFEPVKAIVDEAGATLTFPSGVEAIQIPANALWIRDTGPTFVLAGADGGQNGSQGIAGVDFNFDGWGEKQDHALDADVAEEVCTEADVKRLEAELVIEGGALGYAKGQAPGDTAEGAPASGAFHGELKDYRQPLVTSLGIILGFLLIYLGGWANASDGYLLADTADVVIFVTILVAVGLLTVVVYRMLNPRAPRGEPLAAYQSTLRLYIAGIVVASGGLLLAWAL